MGSDWPSSSCFALIAVLALKRRLKLQNRGNPKKKKRVRNLHHQVSCSTRPLWMIDSSMAYVSAVNETYSDECYYHRGVRDLFFWGPSFNLGVLRHFVRLKLIWRKLKLLVPLGKKIPWLIIYLFSDDSISRLRSLVIQQKRFGRKPVYLNISTDDSISRLRSPVIQKTFSPKNGIP